MKEWDQFLPESVMRFPKLYVALVADLSHLQVSHTLTRISRPEVSGWPVPSHTETRSVFPKYSSDRVNFPLPESQKAPQGLQEQTPHCPTAPSRLFPLSPEELLTAFPSSHGFWLLPNLTASSLSAFLLPAGCSPVNPSLLTP